MKLEWLREHYFFELTRKQQLESAINLPVAVLVALAGLVGLYAREFSAAPTDRWSLALDVLLGLSIILLLLVFLNVVLTFLRYEYEELAPTRDLLIYHQDLRTYYAATNQSPEVADSEFAAALTHRYAEAIDRNAFGNVSKAARLYWAKTFLAGAAFLLALCAVPYFRLTASEREGKTSEAFPMHWEEPQMSQGGQKLPEPNPQQPPKPQPPPNRPTRQGDQPKEKR